MTTSLSTRQGLLTKVSGKLSTLLDDAQQEATIQVPAEAERKNSYLQGKKLQLTKMKKSVEAVTANVDAALQAYTEAADALDSNTPQLTAIIERVSANSMTTQDLLLRAHAAISELEMALEDVSVSAALDANRTRGHSYPARALTHTQIQWESMGVGKFLECL
ncbi:unnamed protein product [Heligmosomoides polygyrus]|uniref:Tubulin-specific chaperone A n=1 Tax=Heligmosomoides polygyrus TaxID=6339 RepID=A0A183GLI2_HELPZ|nr:unnamed protein product [Heligmosomoides polygyrus]